MDNETKAWIVNFVVLLIFISNDIFDFLSTKETRLLLLVTGIAFTYILAKIAAREALKEHHRFDK